MTTSAYIGFTDTASQMDLGSSGTKADVFDDTKDHFVVSSSQIQHFPHLYTDLVASKLDGEGGAVYYAPESFPTNMLQMNEMVRDDLMNVLCMFFTNRIRSAVLKTPAEYRNRVPLWPLLSLDPEGGVIGPHAVRLLANDFRAVQSDTKTSEDLTYFLRSDGSTVNYAEMYEQIRDKCYATATRGGLIALW